jgi:hypothetical protein
MVSEVVLLTGKATFSAMGALAGISLVRVARRTGGFPPEAWAGAMVFIGGAGLLLYAAGGLLAAGSPSLAQPMMITGDLAERIALGLLYLFIWTVFRREEPWARGLVGMGIAALAASFVLELQSGNLSQPDPGSMAYRTSQLVFALPFLWSAAETRNHYLRIRKQVALGLTEPMICNRFLLWSLATAAFAGICFAAIAASIAGASGHETIQAVFVITRGALFYTISVVIGIGFHPPAAYRSYVEQRATTKAS